MSDHSNLGSGVKPEEQVQRLLELAPVKRRISRVPDYWLGVEDALRWMLGEDCPTSVVFNFYVGDKV